MMTRVEAKKIYTVGKCLAVDIFLKNDITEIWIFKNLTALGNDDK